MGKVVEATQSFVAQMEDGKKTHVVAGSTRVDAGHELAVRFPQHFKEIEANFGVEAATDNPGEFRARASTGSHAGSAPAGTSSSSDSSGSGSASDSSSESSKSSSEGTEASDLTAGSSASSAGAEGSQKTEGLSQTSAEKSAARRRSTTQSK